MDNSISQFSIGELLDGRYFYIPAYQRGYRWTEKQVGDLLRDLLCFANDKKGDFDFYCLQPIIARPITDETRLKSILKDNYNNFILEKGVWEIIDGQQRLTTLFLLYKYLIEEKNWDAKKLMEEEGKELYHIIYETREGSASFLENLNLSQIDQDDDVTNIDYFHMSRAFKYINEWVKTEGKEINKRYNISISLDNVRQPLFYLLNNLKDTKGGSIQVLWYEIAEDQKQSSIKEFQKINTGKIRLTDAELVKGLFLLNKNFEEGDKFIKQSTLALEWEYIENTLHANNFWYFLQRKGTDMPNRIDLLFSLLYKKAAVCGLKEEEWDDKLIECERDIQDAKKSTIFRFYYNKFEGKQGEDLQKTVSESWKEVMTLFRTLDDWFCTPQTYNLIGLLSQCGEDICRLIMHYESMPEDATQDSFAKYLKERVKFYLRNVKRDANGDIISTYKDRDNIYKILLTLNIHLLNSQNSKMLSDSNIYKFPFDVLNAQDWDIEHIDSFHTNALKDNELKMEWIDTAKEDLKNELSEEDFVYIGNKMKSKDYDNVITMLKKKAGEEDLDEDVKNGIGNLTLLDAQTNRSYGNSLFCTKRRIIIERIMQGVFVPTATQYIFSKFYDKKGTNRSVWSQNDMKEYQAYIVSQLEDYLPALK